MNPIPFWVWPVAVCLVAWMFRRSVVQGAVLGKPVGLLRASPAGPPGSKQSSGYPSWFPAAGRPLALSVTGGDGYNVGPLLDLWRRLAGNRTAKAAVQVLARTAIGPQQQIVLARVWNREYALLAQAGASPQILATRAAGETPVRRKSRLPRGRTSIRYHREGRR